MNSKTLMEIDAKHVWHPYSAIGSGLPVFPVASADGVRITLADGRVLIDGMASWWSVIHGYNHPKINAAMTQQISRVSHVMFGGLTHQPAARLAQRLVDMTPAPLSSVFFSDSGSVAVEVALKMAIQYWVSRGLANKKRMITLRGGYHGDTFAAMSVSDPENGMHGLFSGAISQQVFVDVPAYGLDAELSEADFDLIEQGFASHADQLAAMILEPVVQGAGGMRFYNPKILIKIRELCDQYNVLLIVDEIATGFGRTGKLFACEHADISADILCLGKALTGGYLSMGATLATKEVSSVISQGNPGLFMHGPTFMANPLACEAANASLALLDEGHWHGQVRMIERCLLLNLMPLREIHGVTNVRVLGAIGVVEMKHPVDMNVIQPLLVDEGVWIRPFGKLVYIMPPYIISEVDLLKLIATIRHVLGMK